MSVHSKAIEAGILDPAELAMLGRAFERSTMAFETERQREARAARILGYFMAGISDEDELVALARQPLGR
jgi:hypothetical protein